MVPVMDAFKNSDYEEIICSCGSQMGKSEAMLNIFGAMFDDGPRVPALMVQPNEKLTRSFSNDRVMKMIESAENLYNRLDRGQKDKVTEKFIAGIRWGFAWAGSATELASHPVGLGILDEVDRMEASVRGEGDPVVLVAARLKNYFNSKLGCFSTPTTWPGSKITQLWHNGTMGKYAWPCPGCGGFFVPKLKLLTWNKKDPVARIRKDAYLLCPLCEEKIRPIDKQAINAAGRYEYHVIKDHEAEETEIEAVGPDPPENTIASFWISGLCSPWQSFGDIAGKMATAYKTKNQETIKAALNTYCGEYYQVRGKGQSWHELRGLIGAYEPGTVPEKVQLITLGADVQALGIYYTVRGWGFNQTSWKIESGFIPGETEFLPVWSIVAQVIEKDFDGMKIKRAFIDSGFNTSQVYNFTRRFPGRVYPTKGQDQQVRPLIMAKVDLSLGGRILKGGIKLYHQDTNYFKTWLYSRYKWPILESGAFHLDAETTDDYLKQITAEQLIVTDAGKQSWKQIRTDNHYLDAEVNAAAAAHSLQVHSLPEYDQRTKTTPKTAPGPQKSFVGGRSGFVRKR